VRAVMNQVRRSRAIIENEQAAVREAAALLPVENAPRLRAELLRLFQKTTLVRGTRFAANIGDRWAEWEKLSDKDLATRLQDLRKEAQRLLDVQADLQRKNEV